MSTLFQSSRIIPTLLQSSRIMSTLLQSSTSLNLSGADAICSAAIDAVSNLTAHTPVCVTVLDSHGGILVQKRMDGCPDGAFPKFSYAKARTCIHLQTSSRTFRTKYTSGGEPAKFTQAASMVSIMEGELVPVAGGVLIQDSDGNTVGAVGVSGAAADEDEYLAWQGVKSVSEAAGLKTVPEEHSCTTLSRL